MQSDIEIPCSAIWIALEQIILLRSPHDRSFDLRPFQLKQEDDPDFKPYSSYVKPEVRQRVRWTIAEIISFLRLLKPYPEIYRTKRIRSDSEKQLRIKSFSRLLVECKEKQLPLRNLPTLKKRISTLRLQFTIALSTYKSNISKGLVFNKPNLRWFDEASFLDPSGFVDMSIKPVTISRWSPWWSRIAI